MRQFVGGNRHYPILAEVGASQHEITLNARAADLLEALSGVVVVILIKIHDDTLVEDGRMHAWCVTQNADGTFNHSPKVEFGCVGVSGAAQVAWAPPAAPK
mmetsp:Transcript_7925/g.12137  ORF Transcript_7925/g.12137 Transcript_7925/m.12137 type:complete len:101 (-) Transcript_7925:128-430(-)